MSFEHPAKLITQDPLSLVIFLFVVAIVFIVIKPSNKMQTQILIGLCFVIFFALSFIRS